MKIIAPAAIVLVLALSSGGVLSSTASAQPSIEVGPRGVRVNPDADRYERRGYRRGERCEVRVERRRNRFGEMVTRRERICR